MVLCKKSILIKVIDLSFVVFVEGALRSLDWRHLAMPLIISMDRKRILTNYSPKKFVTRVVQETGACNFKILRGSLLSNPSPYDLQLGKRVLTHKNS